MKTHKKQTLSIPKAVPGTRHAKAKKAATAAKVNQTTKSTKAGKKLPASFTAGEAREPRKAREAREARTPRAPRVPRNLVSAAEAIQPQHALNATSTDRNARDPYYEREVLKYENPLPSREFILATLKEQGVPVAQYELSALLDIQIGRAHV